MPIIISHGSDDRHFICYIKGTVTVISSEIAIPSGFFAGVKVHDLMDFSIYFFNIAISPADKLVVGFMPTISLTNPLSDMERVN